MGCKILTYEEIDRSQWEKLVRESRTGTWFQSPEAYDFFATQKDLMEPFVVAISRQPSAISHQTLCGVCIGYITRERNKLKQFFTRRAIINGGPVFADDCTNEEVQFLMEAVRAKLMNEPLRSMSRKHGLLNDGPIYIETRNFNDYSQWREAFERVGFEHKKHLNFHVDCMDEEAMWERLTENRRRQIKRASTAVSLNDAAKLLNEPQANLLNDENDVREWYAILQELYRTKVKTPLWPVEFFLKAYRQGVGKFLLIKHEGTVIGGSMIVELTSERMNELTNERRGCVYEWFECGLNAEYKEQYPSVMATWAGMKYAAEHGLARYDMMGAGEPGVPYGVRDFKSEFGGEMVEQGRFLCICKPWLYKIGKLGVRLLKGFKF